MKIEMDGKVIALNTDKRLNLKTVVLNFIPYLPVVELQKQIPDFVKDLGISVDEIADKLAIEKRTWDIYKLLLANGFTFEKTRDWFSSIDPAIIDPRIAYPKTAQDFGWMFQTLLPTIKHDHAPNFLAGYLSDFLRKLLDDENNLLVLLNLKVDADVLVKTILTAEQITKYLKTLLKFGGNVNFAIERVGYCPDFYLKYPISFLVLKANASPLDIARNIFDIKKQQPDEEVLILEQLCCCGMHLSDFVNQVVIKEKTNLHVVVDNAYYFKIIRRMDVKSILEDLRIFNDNVAESVLDDRLIVLANYSKLKELGIVDKKVLRKWKRVIGSLRISEVLDYRCLNYSLEAEENAERNRRGGGEKAETSTKESKTAEKGNTERSKVAIKKEVKKSRKMEPQMPARERQVGLRVLD